MAALYRRGRASAHLRGAGLARRPTGRGEGVLGWLLTGADHAGDPRSRNSPVISARKRRRRRSRARRTYSAVLYDIAYLSSSISDRAAFLHAVHARLGTLIDAENFYLALYDPATSMVTYPYYVDVIDTEAVDPGHMDRVDPERLSLTGHVITTGQPLLIGADGIAAAEAAGYFRCVGQRPEFWMGAPLKNASDQVIGMVAMLGVRRFAYLHRRRPRALSGRGAPRGDGARPYPASRRSRAAGRAAHRRALEV